MSFEKQGKPWFHKKSPTGLQYYFVFHSVGVVHIGSMYHRDILIVLFLNVNIFSVDKRRQYSLHMEGGDHGREAFLGRLSLCSSAFCSFEAASICAALKSAVAM